MKINKKVYFLGVALLATFSVAGSGWSSNGLPKGCIACGNQSEKYCKYRNQGPEIVECFKLCSKNPAIGQNSISSCFKAMAILAKPGLWDVPSRQAFEAWYREIGGEAGLAGWRPENKQKAVALMHDLPANSEHVPEPVRDLPANSEHVPEPVRDLPASSEHVPESAKEIPFNSMMYLALNPDLLKEVREVPLDEIPNALKKHYQTVGSAHGRVAHPDATHRIPGYHTAGRPKDIPSTFNPMEYLALHPDILNYYTSKRMTLEQALMDAEAHYSNNGRAEGRGFSLGFTDEPKAPKSKATSKDSANEVQIIEQKFDPMLYIALHPDIAHYYKDQPIHKVLVEVTDHYKMVGVHEKRAHVATSPEMVPRLIPDLPGDVVKHLPANFNAAIYLVRHPDVFQYYTQNPSVTLDALLKESATHYANAGRNEGRNHGLEFGEGQAMSSSSGRTTDSKEEKIRQEPKQESSSSQGESSSQPSQQKPAFDPILYLAMNPKLVTELKDHPIHEALILARKHYEEKGRMSKLLTRPDATHKAPYIKEMGPPKFGPGFNPLVYLSIHADIFEYYAKEDRTLEQVIKDAAEHFGNAGKAEGRTILMPGGVVAPPPIIPPQAPNNNKPPQKTLLEELQEKKALNHVENSAGQEKPKEKSVDPLLAALQRASPGYRARELEQEEENSDDDW